MEKEIELHLKGWKQILAVIIFYTILLKIGEAIGDYIFSHLRWI